MYRRFTAKERLHFVLLVLRDGNSVIRVSREAGVSRKTLYLWIQRYETTKEAEKLRSLEDKAWQISKHPRKIQPSLRYQVLKYIQKNPTFSVRRIVREIQKQFPSLGRHGVLNILQEFNLLSREKRAAFSAEKKKLKSGCLYPQERFLLFESVRIEGLSVHQACVLFHVSRKTYYKWYKTYEKHPAWIALSNKEWKIIDHPRRLSSEWEKQILDLVVAYPELSKHKIAALMPETSDGKKLVGNHGVYNVLHRFDLTTFEKRYHYAQTHRISEVILPTTATEVIPVPLPKIAQAPIHGPPLSRVMSLVQYVFSSRQRLSQPSPLARLPSSHCSSSEVPLRPSAPRGWRMPSPQ